MPKNNPANARLKRDYFIWLKQARGRSEASIDAAAQALARFETYTRNRPFKRFHVHQAIGFKEHLLGLNAERSGKPLSLATVSAILAQVKCFFLWLADQPGFRRVVTHADSAYFSLTERDERVATATTARPRPTIDQLMRVLEGMPSQSVIERRDRAVVAFGILTGARDGTYPGLRLSHLDLMARMVRFDPRDVHTKFGKDVSTWFFPVPPRVEAIVQEWAQELQTAHHFGPGDPLFPRTLVGLDDEQRFGAKGLAREPWSTATPVRQIFKAACERVGLPYFNPHGVRHALGVLGTQLCRTPEEMKAWSQNLGHDHVMTTLSAYSKVPDARQAELILGLGARNEEQTVLGVSEQQVNAVVRAVLAQVKAGKEGGANG